MSTSSVVTSKGQVTIPVALRKQYTIQEGDRLIFEKQVNGIFISKAQPLDVLYLHSLQVGLSVEWDSDEDSTAYNNL